MKYTKKTYRRGRNQGRTRKTAIRKEVKISDEGTYDLAVRLLDILESYDKFMDWPKKKVMP